MARKGRRTFWRDAYFSTEVSTPATVVSEQMDGPNSDASISLYTRDAVPTLLRIVGTLIVTSTRAETESSDPDTEAAVWGAGFCCMESDADFVSPLKQLEHEQWLQTFAGRVEHEAQAQAYGVLLAVGIHYAINHAAPYPQIREVRSKAKRVFEDPCRLMFFGEYDNVAGLEPVASVKFTFVGRTLWLAS